MPLGVPVTLTENAIVGLSSIQRYRFLTIDQFSRIACLHRPTAVGKLRLFERQGFLGHFGNIGIRGYGKTPKVYFLTRKGWELLRSESGIPEELLGAHKEVKTEASWSPQMYHRLRTVDLLISLEVAVRNRPHLGLVNTFLDYRRHKRGERIVQETTDYVDAEESAENKIIPDAACILENTNTKRRALFFLEMDMGTERITTAFIGNKQTVLHQKFFQYDRYLKSFRYTKTYAEYGDFRSFTLLFVTLQEARIENTRRGEFQVSSDGHVSRTVILPFGQGMSISEKGWMMWACPQCASDRLVNNSSAAGKPKKQCKQCGYQFTRTTPRGKPLATKINAILWYLSGMSMNRAAFLLHVSAQTVLNWIRDFAIEHYEKPEPTGKTIVLELDEMWHYLKKKRQKLWIWKALDRETGRLLDWECGRRDKKTLQKMVDRLTQWDVQVYCADKWRTYASVIPQEKLVQSKTTTHDIERNHCRQRHWFGRFKRKSIIVSKSQEMVDLTMALFAKFWVNGNQDGLISLLT